MLLRSYTFRENNIYIMIYAAVLTSRMTPFLRKCHAQLLQRVISKKAAKSCIICGDAQRG